MTITDVFTTLTSILPLIWSTFSNVITTITGNPLLFVPVLVSLAGGITLFCVGMVRKFGVRGVSASGGKKRMRRG